MNGKIKYFLAVIFVALGVIAYIYRPRGGLVGSPHKNLRHEKLLALLVGADNTLTLGKHTKARSCHMRGSLPDPSCTPGAIFPTTTVKQVCTSGYTKSVRSVSVKMKKDGYAAYDLAYPQKTGSYEFDHLIPLELGGSNDVANLFPEAATPKPGFREKDLVENYLNNKVCDGEITLSSAQKQIAHDWVAVYNLLTPEEITELRNKIRSFSN